jgi:hypothetical protein
MSYHEICYSNTQRPNTDGAEHYHVLCNVVPNGSRSYRYHNVDYEFVFATQHRVFVSHILRINARGIDMTVCDIVLWARFLQDHKLAERRSKY